MCHVTSLWSSCTHQLMSKEAAFLFYNRSSVDVFESIYLLVQVLDFISTRRAGKKRRKSVYFVCSDMWLLIMRVIKINYKTYKWVLHTDTQSILILREWLVVSVCFNFCIVIFYYVSYQLNTCLWFFIVSSRIWLFAMQLIGS